MSSYNTSQFRPQMRFALPRLTWAVRMLILVTSGIFAAQLLIDPLRALLTPTPMVEGIRMLPPGGMINDWLGFDPSLLLRGAVWMPFTYMFLHGGLMHLFMNMLWLFIFGPEVERALGTRHFFRFYIVCGAVGVLAVIVSSFLLNQETTVTGASGAVMGVLVAFAVLDPKRQFYMFPLPFPITAMGLVFLVLAMNIFMFFQSTGVSVETHLGGMAVGYAYMKLLPSINRWQLARARTKEEAREKKLNKVGEAVDNIFDFKDRNRR